MARTLIQKFVADVRLVVRGSRQPSAGEFDDHVSEAVARAESTRVVLVALVGDGSHIEFDSEQRAKLSNAGLFSKPHAVLAPAIKPEIVLSRKWVGAQIRNFGADGFEDACDFLEIDPELRPQLYSALAWSRAYFARGAPSPSKEVSDG